MKRTVAILIGTVLVTSAWLAGPDPAEAGELSISLGVGFVVGGASFQVAYATGGYFPYYYRLEAPLYYPGYGCTTHCYVRGRHIYHDPFCPLVRHHFNRYRYDGWRHHYPRWRDARYRHYYGPGKHRSGHRYSRHPYSGHSRSGYHGLSRGHYRDHSRRADRHRRHEDRGRSHYDDRNHQRGRSKGHGARKHDDRSRKRRDADRGRGHQGSRDSGGARRTRPPRG